MHCVRAIPNCLHTGNADDSRLWTGRAWVRVVYVLRVMCVLVHVHGGLAYFGWLVFVRGRGLERASQAPQARVVVTTQGRVSNHQTWVV